MALRGKRYQGVTAFVGMPGSGKTYGLAQVGRKALERGEKVYSNAGFDLQGSEIISTFDDFAALEGPAIVCWDELPLYFNARKWQEFPDSMLYKFTQIRKDGLQLYYSAIHEAMIDTNIRRITFWYWHCSAITGRWLRRSLWPPEEFRKSSMKPRRKEWVWVDNSTAALYDTTSKVALPQKVRDRIAKGVAEVAPWDALDGESPAVPDASSGGPLDNGLATLMEPVAVPDDPDVAYAGRHQGVGVWEDGPSWRDDGYEVVGDA